MSEISEKDLHQAYEEIITAQNRACEIIQKVVGANPAPMESVQLYEALRRSEDFISRVGHIMALKTARTREAVDKAVEAAIENGTVVTPPAQG